MRMDRTVVTTRWPSETKLLRIVSPPSLSPHYSLLFLPLVLSTHHGPPAARGTCYQQTLLLVLLLLLLRWNVWTMWSVPDKQTSVDPFILLCFDGKGGDLGSFSAWEIVKRWVGSGLSFCPAFLLTCGIRPSLYASLHLQWLPSFLYLH